MKSKLLSLLLVLVMLANVFVMAGCDLVFPYDDPSDPVDDPKPDPDPEPDPDPDPTPDDPLPAGSFRISDAKLYRIISEVLNQVDYCMQSYNGGLPGAYSTNNVYPTSTKNTSGWIQGFWPGTLFNAYELSGDAKYKDLALSFVDSFYTRIDEKLGVNNHDMGFLYTPSCVAAYKLTGDETAKAAAIMAADNLLTRYHEDAGFIQAWGAVGAEEEYRLIADCMMNLPLLYWASEVTGNAKYANAANSHLLNSIETLYREDGSTYHTYFFDVDTKEPKENGGKTHQGNADESAWARGQSWAMYGPILAYRYTENERALEAFISASDYFIDHLASDYIPYWDFDYTDGSDEPRDTSAGAIAACALLEGVNYLDETDPRRDKYLTAAHKILNALIDNHRASSVRQENGLLTGATQNRKTNKGVEEMTPYGDYFFIEAILRLKEGAEFTPYW